MLGNASAINQLHNAMPGGSKSIIWWETMDVFPLKITTGCHVTLVVNDYNWTQTHAISTRLVYLTHGNEQIKGMKRKCIFNGEYVSK